MYAVHGIAIQILPCPPMVIFGLSARFRRKSDEETTPINQVSRSAKGGCGKPEIQQIQANLFARLRLGKEAPKGQLLRSLSNLGFSAAAGKKTAGQIEKETNEHRTSNAQRRTSNNVFCLFKID